MVIVNNVYNHSSNIEIAPAPSVCLRSTSDIDKKVHELSYTPI